jgi:hypothetical protein
MYRRIVGHHPRIRVATVYLTAALLPSAMRLSRKHDGSGRAHPARFGDIFMRTRKTARKAQAK